MKSSIDNPNNQIIDWDKTQLVETGDIVVLTNGSHNDTEFSGTVIYTVDTEDYSIGEYDERWVKTRFIISDKIVKLKNGF